MSSKEEVNYREVNIKCCDNCNFIRRDYEDIYCKKVDGYIKENHICDLYNNDI